jgi:hypothetical protein
MHLYTIITFILISLLDMSTLGEYCFQELPNFAIFLIQKSNGITEAVAQSGETPNIDIGEPIKSKDYLDGERYTELVKRIDVLEAVKASLQSWITILIFTITVLASANIGLSVWQVGSITRKEVENSLKDYNSRFEEMINNMYKDIEGKLSNYGRTAKDIIEEVRKIENEIDIDKSELTTSIADIKNKGDVILEKIKVEGEIMKNDLVSKLTDHHRRLVTKTQKEQHKT